MNRKPYPQFLFIFIIILSLLLSCVEKKAPITGMDIFDRFQPGYNLMAFLSDTELHKLEVVSDSMQSVLEQNGFVKDSSLPLVIGNDTVPIPEGGLIWQNPSSGINIFLKEFKTKGDTQSAWPDYSHHIGYYAGIQNRQDGFYYLKLDSIYNTHLNATFKSDHYIFEIRAPFNFKVPSIDELNEKQIGDITVTNNHFIETLELLKRVLVPKQDLVYAPSNGRLLTEDERLFGFINFWTEVKYNFAFFDQVPDLDWEAVLLEYLPKVKNATSNFEYYQTLEEVCALLNDGHTNVYPPVELLRYINSPAVELSALDGSIYITNTSVDLAETIPLGSQLIRVDKTPVENYIEKNIRPYISSSTEHIRRNWEVRKLLDGNRDKPVSIEIKTPEGEIKNLSLDRNPGSIEWINSSEPWELSSYKQYGDIAYVSLNSFNSSDIVDAFDQYLDDIKQSKALIIDLRKNGGGNSWNGYNILKQLTDQPLVTSKWKTREHKPAYKAWGAFVDEESEHLGSWDRETLASYKDDFWHESGPDTIYPEKDRTIKLPVAVLIGNNTASAAEDFLIAADPLDNFTTIGDYTFGSTGQPMLIRLPGGGKARICTKRDSYPDGREFVGYGVMPDVRLKKTLNDILTDSDPVLDYAKVYLQEKMVIPNQ